MRTRNQIVDNPLGPSEVKGLAFSMCTAAEKEFLFGVYELKRNLHRNALTHFERSFRADITFYNSAFCAAALRLSIGQVVEARGRFLKLLSADPDFLGAYILRFMPGFRLMLELREGLHYCIRPEAPDIAVLVGVLYEREGRYTEAKKALQQALNADHSNKLGRVMLADVLINEGRAEAGLKYVEKMLPDFKSPLDGLIMNVRGHGHLATGDIRTGLLLLEGASRIPFKGLKVFRDTLNIEAGREFELREYLVDAFDALKDVSDITRMYTNEENVGVAKQRLAARINTMAKSGISKPLSLSKGVKKQFRKEDFWELGRDG
jgi:tetratricopeptide (TPR) repeat protein